MHYLIELITTQYEEVVAVDRWHRRIAQIGGMHFATDDAGAHRQGCRSPRMGARSIILPAVKE